MVDRSFESLEVHKFSIAFVINYFARIFCEASIVCARLMIYCDCKFEKLLLIFLLLISDRFLSAKN